MFERLRKRNSEEAMKLRIQLATQRKWMVLGTASIVLAILCNSSFRVFLLGVGLILRAVGKAMDGVSSVIQGIGSLIYRLISLLVRRK